MRLEMRVKFATNRQRHEVFRVAAAALDGSAPRLALAILINPSH